MILLKSRVRLSGESDGDLGICGGLVWRPGALHRSKLCLDADDCIKNTFKVAMMYDEADEEEGATDQAIADLTMFHDTYLSSTSSGIRRTSLTKAGP
jgi:hypothetical protein